MDNTLSMLSQGYTDYLTEDILPCQYQYYCYQPVCTGTVIPIIKDKSGPYCHGRSGSAFHEYFPCD